MRRSIAFILGSVLFLSFPLFSEDSFFKKLEYSVSVDLGIYPKSDYISGESHFAPLTGPYSAMEGRIVGGATYRIPTPLGDNFLVADANLALTGKLELTPVSIKPAAVVTFTPLPFLVFEAGAEAGSGWDLGNLFVGGIAAYNDNPLNVGYNSFAPFSHWFLKAYFQGTFQFDTGVILGGDWSHIVMLFTYQTYYHSLTGVENGDIWKWQCAGLRANGLREYMCGILAYQMPLVVKRVGVLFESDGFYSTTAFNQYKYGGYKSNFKTISISPLVQFEFDSHNTLNVLAGFSSRQSFVEPHTSEDEEPFLTYSGREWFFNRIALSWTYTF